MKLNLDAEHAIAILDLLRQGLRYREISDRVHYSLSYVCNYRKAFVAAGMLPAKRLTARQLKIKSMLEQGMSCTEIARELKVSPGTVHRDRKILAQYSGTPL